MRSGETETRREEKEASRAEKLRVNQPPTFTLPTPAEIEAKRLRASIRREAIFATINFLVSRYSKRGQIDQRVLQLAFYLKCPELKCATQKELAKKLKLSKQRISVAVDSHGHRIEEICRDSKA